MQVVRPRKRPGAIPQEQSEHLRIRDQPGAMDFLWSVSLSQRRAKRPMQV